MDPEVMQGFVGLAGAPFVVGLTEWIKRSFPDLSERWWPTVSIAWGLALNLGWAAVMLRVGLTTQPALLVLTIAAVIGVAAGLMASGLYSGARATLQ
ncbi:MAG: hypothetical protein ACYC4L_04590 [Chloroflexota bacterium]